MTATGSAETGLRHGDPGTAARRDRCHVQPGPADAYRQVRSSGGGHPAETGRRPKAPRHPRRLPSRPDFRSNPSQLARATLIARALVHIPPPCYCRSRMIILEFIAKWRKVELKERSAAQEHVLDLCNVFDHPAVAAAYGWPPGLTDEQILAHLLQLNFACSPKSGDIP